jgi:uncharacterized membrane protein YqjE
MEQDKNLVELINSITENVTTLVRGHIELAKAEAIEALKNLLKSSVLFLIALNLIILGKLILIFAFAFWLSEKYEWNTSTGFFVVAGIIYFFSIIFIVIAAIKLAKIKKSRKTIDSLNATSQTLQSLIPGKK